MTWLDDNLASLAAEYEVPGVQVAVLADDTVVDAAAGVLSLTTGVEATTDSVFQIGSVTKLLTATLVLQLVDEGRLDLDAPVRRYLPGFRVVDEVASATVTARQLLCHTAGFDGDVFAETTRDDDAVRRYVEDVLPTVAQLSRPGELHSYNNAGFVVLGRLVEVLRGASFHTALREHLAGPLGLRHIATTADEAILFRAAVGHVRSDPDSPLEPTSTWAIAHSNAPAGAMLAMSARDVLGFVRMHLAGGVAADGARVLSAHSAAAMRDEQVRVPRLEARPRFWGLGWMLLDWAGGTVIGHDGGTIGQSACLRVVPEAGVGVVVLANGGAAGPLARTVLGHVLGELSGVRVPDSITPPATPAPVTDPRRYVGRYEIRSVRIDVEADDDGRLLLTVTPLAEMVALMRPERHRLVRHSDDTFVDVEERDGGHFSVCFLSEDSIGRARFVHVGRALPRVF
ncbi:MAG: serine hydrolase domain-containing protein [Actinocatenispora sp.]